MKTGNTASVKHTGGGGAGPVGGGGAGPVGGRAVDTGDGGAGPVGGRLAGGGPRSKAILERIAKHFGHLSKAFDDLANTPVGGVPSGKGTAKKK
jgi:hypothetical protein